MQFCTGLFLQRKEESYLLAGIDVQHSAGLIRCGWFAAELVNDSGSALYQHFVVGHNAFGIKACIFQTDAYTAAQSQSCKDAGKIALGNAESRPCGIREHLFAVFFQFKNAAGSSGQAALHTQNILEMAGDLAADPGRYTI